MHYTIAAVAGLALIDLFFVLRYGYEGPLCETKRGPRCMRRCPRPFTLPDAVWVFPLMISLFVWANSPNVALVSHRVTLDCGIAGLVLVLITTRAYRTICGWSASLPKHLHFLADFDLKGHRWRFLIRCGTWQALLLLTPTTQLAVSRLGGLLIVPAGLLLIHVLFLMFHIPHVSNKRKTYDNPFSRVPKKHSDGSSYDWFISYRSLHANAVRGLVDSLIASGKRVWFAEYMIRFFARDLFQPAIDQGIEQSRSGLLVTDETYATSEHTLEEFAQMLDAYDRKPREYGLAETYFGSRSPLHPPAVLPPEAQEFLAQRWEINPADVSRRLSESRYCRDLTPHAVPDDQQDWLRLLEETEAPSRSALQTLKEDCVHVDPFGIVASIAVPADARRGYAENLPSDHTGSMSDFRFRLGQYPCTLVLTISKHRDLVEESLQTATIPVPTARRDLTESSVVIGETATDRSRAATIRNFEMIRTAVNGEECVGCHLFWYGGRSHTLLTLWAKTCWLRRYYITVPLPDSDSQAQFRFDFQFRGPFGDLLLHGRLFDDIVASLRTEPIDRSPDSKLEADSTAQSVLPDIPRIEAGLDQQLASEPNSTLPDRLTLQACELVEKAWNYADAKSREAFYSAALRRLERAIAADSTWAPAYHERAQIFSRLGRFREAIEAVESALRFVPNQPKYITTWCSVHVDQAIAGAGNVDDLGIVQEQVDRLIHDHPTYPSPCFVKAELAVLTGRPQSEWEKCLQLGADRYRSVIVMPSGDLATAKDICATLVQVSLKCCALAQRFSCKD